MRLSKAANYEEFRDSISRDWGKFISWSVPEAVWMPLPNLGERCVQMADAWGVNSLILTGGDDLGDDTIRDNTERYLFDAAECHGWPVLGVCRGFQFLNRALGGSMSRQGKNSHVATTHQIEFIEDFYDIKLRGRTAAVNSFHQIGINRKEVASQLEVIAVCEDGTVEAASQIDRRMLGLMWHPERNSVFSNLDRSLLRSLFGLPDNEPEAQA
jgi:putative glutamine amidotransferase